MYFLQTLAIELFCYSATLSTEPCYFSIVTSPCRPFLFFYSAICEFSLQNLAILLFCYCEFSLQNLAIFLFCFSPCYFAILLLWLLPTDRTLAITIMLFWLPLLLCYFSILLLWFLSTDPCYFFTLLFCYTYNFFLQTVLFCYYAI